MLGIDVIIGFLQYWLGGAYETALLWFWMIALPALTLYLMGIGFLVMLQKWDALKNYLLWPFRKFGQFVWWVLSSLYARAELIWRTAVWALRWLVWIVLWPVSWASRKLNAALERFLSWVRPGPRP